MKNILKFLPFLFITALISSCSNDDDTPEPVNEEEVITTLIATFVPQGGGSTVTLITRDLDGDGPNAPVNEVSGSFASNTTYTGSLQFLNEMKSPAEDITEEINEENEDHQIFLSATNDLGLFTYIDSDANSDPVGLDFTFKTSEATTALNGVITITLRHQPNKGGTGVSNGDITNAGGETDFQSSFNVTVE